MKTPDQLRSELRAAATERTPPAPDVSRLIHRARRRTRLRVVAGAVPVAAVIAVIALVAPGILPGHATTGPAGRSGRPPNVVVGRFDPLTRMVRLGWTPPGLTVAQWETSPTSAALFAVPTGSTSALTDGKGLTVEVHARGVPFDSGEGGIGIPEVPEGRTLQPAAPVDGGAARCLAPAGSTAPCTALRWEYGPGAYAEVAYAPADGSSPQQVAAVVRHVAETLVIAPDVKVTLPFRVTGPAAALTPVATLVSLRTDPEFVWSTQLSLSSDPAHWTLYGSTGTTVTIGAERMTGTRFHRDAPPNTTVDHQPANVSPGSLYAYGADHLRTDISAPSPWDVTDIFRHLVFVADPADRGTWVSPRP